MKKIYLLFLPILFLSCKQNVIDTGELIEELKVIKTPREMTWTADTLKPQGDAFQLLALNLLVFSTKDLWLCCDSDVARGLLWHYDGNKWTESNIANDVGGMRVNDIAGYSSKDLWTVGYSGQNIFLAHYDGSHWMRQNDMNIKGELIDMCKDPSGNLWACGRDGVVMNYDKSRWNADTIKVGYMNKYPTAAYLLKSIQFHSNKLHILGSVFDFNRGRNIFYYFSGTTNNWHIIDSMVIDSPSSKIKWGYSNLCIDKSNSLYSTGLTGLWKFNQDNWGMVKNIEGTLYYADGINNNYLITVGDFNKILFYNGTIWEDLSYLSGNSVNYKTFDQVWTDGYETFIIGYGNIGGSTGSIVFHGK